MSDHAIQRLYHDDARLLSFTASVVHITNHGHAVVLDRTAFYPTSGGQPYDTGTLNGIRVVDVTEADATIVHHLASPLPDDAVIVAGEIDRDRRRDHMQQHSGQHLLSALLEDRFGWPTVSVHIGRDGCSLDLATESVPIEALRDAERLANRLVSENRPVTVSYEDATTAQGLRKPSDRSGQLRIVTIADLDRNACGGTHVAQTGEIGAVLLRRTERMRGCTRVEFLCGGRAIARARHDAELLTALGAAFSAAVDDLPALVAAQREQARAADKECARLREQLAAYEAQSLYRATKPLANGCRLQSEILADAPVKSRQTFAQQFVAGGTAVCVIVSHAPPAVLLAASADAGIDCAAVLRAALAQVGGRGGGTSTLAQGSVASVADAEHCRDVLLKAVGGDELPQ